MTFLRCVYYALRTNALLREQNDELHATVRTLRADLDALNRVYIDTHERMLDAQEMNLEHSLYCVPAFEKWGTEE